MRISLPITNDSWLYLIGIYQWFNENAPMADAPLASVVVAESYERYLKKFTWKPAALTLSVAEGMALHECLTAINAHNSEPDPFITTIIYQLFNLIENAFNSGSVSHLSAPATPPPEGGKNTG